eukprot:g1490.t1
MENTNLTTYVGLLKHGTRHRGVLGLKQSPDNVKYLMECIMQQESSQGSNEILALEYKNDLQKSDIMMGRLDSNILNASRSIHVNQSGDDVYEVTNDGLVIQKRTLFRSSRTEITSTKFEVVTVRTLGAKDREDIITGVSVTENGGLLVKHRGRLTWIAPLEMALDFGCENGVFLLVNHIGHESSLVESGRPLPSKIHNLNNASNHVEFPTVSILQVDQSPSILHVRKSVLGSQIKSAINILKSHAVPSGRGSSRGSTARTNDRECHLFIEQNIVQIFTQSSSLQKAISILVKRFSLDRVREAFESALSTGNSNLPETQYINYPQFPTGGSLKGHCIDIEQTTTSMSSYCQHDPHSRSVSSRLNEEPKEQRTEDFRTGGYTQYPYKKPITEDSWGDGENERDQDRTQSISTEEDARNQFDQYSKESDSSSIRCYETDETSIKHLSFLELICKTIREITQNLRKVTIIVSTKADGKTLIDFIVDKGYKASLAPRGDLETGAYDTIAYNHQVIAFALEDWKMLKTEHKRKTDHLIIALCEGQSDGSILDFQGFQNTQVQQIPFIQESLPKEPHTASSLMPDVPLIPVNNKEDEKSVALVRAPSTPFNQPRNIQSLPLERTVSLHQNESQSRMFADLQNFAKQLISEITNEVRENGHQDFQVIGSEHYRTCDGYMNQLTNWIGEANKKIMRDCYRLHLLKEALKAFSLIYLLGSENTKYLIAPAINEIRESFNKAGGLDEADDSAIQTMEQIMDSPPDSIDSEATQWFKKLLDTLKEAQENKPFRGVVAVYSRITIWAISEILEHLPDFQETKIFPLYSHTKDLCVYGGNRELRLTRNKRMEVLRNFGQTESGILVTVSVSGIEVALSDLDVLVLFGCTSSAQARQIQAKKKWYIQAGFSKSGRIAEIT